MATELCVSCDDPATRMVAAPLGSGVYQYCDVCGPQGGVPIRSSVSPARLEALEEVAKNVGRFRESEERCKSGEAWHDLRISHDRLAALTEDGGGG